MAAKIKLEEPDRAFRPGDIVTGSVELTQCIAPVFVVLQGVAENRFVTGDKIKSHHKSRALLLYMSQTLPDEDDQDAGMDTNRVQAKKEFTFTLPHHTQKINDLPQSDHYWTKESKWNLWKPDPFYPLESGESFPTQSRHPLPPTCKFAAPRLTGIDCLVEYCVSVTNTDPKTAYIDSRLKPSKQRPYITYDRQPFWMVLERVESPWSELNVRKPRDLAFDAVYDGPISAGGRFKRSLNPAGIPQTAFRISLIRPSYVTAGESITISLEITPNVASDHKRDTKKTKPLLKILDLELIAASCKIRPSTTLRAPNGREAHQATHNGPDLLIFDAIKDSDQVPTAEWSADDIQTYVDVNISSESPQQEQYAVSAIPLSDPPNMKRTITFPHLVPRNLTPTFSTYNILRQYRITITLQFKYGDQTKIIDYSFLPIQILPPNEPSNNDGGPYQLETEYSLVLPEYGPDAFDLTNQIANVPVNIAQAGCCVIL